MRALCILLAAADFKPIAEARLRIEGVDQDGFADRAEAITARVRTAFATDTRKCMFQLEYML